MLKEDYNHYIMIKFLFLLTIIICLAKTTERINPFSLRNDEASILSIESLFPKKEIPIPTLLEKPILERPISEKPIPTERVERRIPPQKPRIIEKVILKEVPAKPKIIEKKIIQPKIITLRVDKGFKLTNSVLWGLFSLFSILFLIFYLRTHTRRVSSLPVFRPSKDLTSLKISYFGVEKLLKELEEKVKPLDELGHLSLREYTQENVEKMTGKLKSTVANLAEQQSYIQNFLQSMDKRLLPLEELKGQSLREFVAKIVNEANINTLKDIENKISVISKHQSQKFAEMEEKFDLKLNKILKEFKDTQKVANEASTKIQEFSAYLSGILTEQTTTRLTPKIKPQQIAKQDEQLYKKVYELADGGLAPEEIAKKLKLSKAQVNLILELREKK